ncbi:MAG: hypothetical protein WBN68_21825 [Sedimenticolaceae bacterium]
MKRLFVPFVSIMLLALSIAAWSAQHTPQDLPLVTGEHWTTADLAQKRAFLIGIGNVLEVEQAMAGDNLAAMRGRSIVPVLLNGLSGVGLPDMVAELDTYYSGNPEQLKRPVLEVLYLEMALPRMER